MSIEHAEQLKKELTDKWVVEVIHPQLARTPRNRNECGSIWSDVQIGGVHTHVQRGRML